MSIDLPAIYREAETYDSESLRKVVGFASICQNDLLTISLSSSSAQEMHFDKILESAKNDLKAYYELPQGWDGYGANPLNRNNIEAIESILSMVAKHFENEKVAPSEITPGPASDGSVDIEIVFGDKTLIFSAHNDGKVLGVYLEDRNTSKEIEAAFDSTSVETQLHWLYSKVLGEEAVA